MKKQMFVEVDFKPRDRVKIGPVTGVIASVILGYSEVKYEVQYWCDDRPVSVVGEAWEIELVEAFVE